MSGLILNINQIMLNLGAYILGRRPGRMGIWTQGCNLPLLCPGCTSQQTHGDGGGKLISVDALLALAAQHGQAGVVVSGGEPSGQSEAITLFLQHHKRSFPDAEILLYTGLRFSVFERRFPELLASCDVVVAGPFVRTRPANPLAGSDNQEVKLLTPLARELFSDWESWPRRVQISAQSQQLVAVGIPDTQRLTQAAANLHQPVSQVSWHPQRNYGEPS